MAKDPLPKFEIPPEMRQFAERSVDEAKKAFDGFMTAAQQAVAQVEGRAVAAQAGVDDVRKKAMTFAEQNVASSFEFARKLAQARDLEEVVRLQTEFAKTQMQVLGEQAKELGAQATRATRETGKRKS